MKTSKAGPTAAQHIERLIADGWSHTRIAADLFVDVQSVKRWAAGSHTPQPGSLHRLVGLLKQKKK